MGATASDGAEKARQRIKEVAERLDRLRHGDPVTEADVEAERAHSIASAERAEVAALSAANRAIQVADLEDQFADELTGTQPERAQQHRDKAAAARQRAEHDREEAAVDHSIADQRRHP